MATRAPWDHCLLPSGLLPSVRSRPGGSFIDGIPAFEWERCIMSLIVLCLAIRPKPREQDRPWLSLASIRAPQAHMCGSHIVAPRRKPTATRTSSLSSLNPHAVIGKACNQSLACGDETAFNRAVLYGSIVS